MLYKDIRNELDTGDIILFSGKGAMSTMIKWFTRSKWSHIGMVLKAKELDVIFSWESTTLSNVANVTTGKAVKGVQLVPLSYRINSYDGDIAIRKLNCERTSKMIESLMSFRDEAKGRPYEKDKLELLGCITNKEKDDEDLSSLFCSELVAEAYQRMGLLAEDKPSNYYWPSHFSESGDIEIMNCSLSEETYIKRNG